MLSAIGYGKILQDRNGKIKELQKYTLKKYKNGLPKLGQEDVIYEAKSLQKSIEYLKKMNLEKSPYYNTFYAITLDKIRNYYNRKNGFSNMSTSKVYRLYTDKKMQEVQHKSMPEKQFIDNYINCIKTNEFKQINEKYLLKNIFKGSLKKTNVVIEGADGVGKSTLAKNLALEGIREFVSEFDKKAIIFQRLYLDTFDKLRNYKNLFLIDCLNKTEEDLLTEIKELI